MSTQTITRKHTADCMHRVVDHASKCRNIHGHLYVFEMTFAFNNTEKIGYKVDFAEIKRLACTWIDDYWDHGALINPKDEVMLRTCRELDSKTWIMSLAGEEYCNPTAENIAKELFMVLEILFEDFEGLEPLQVKLFETPKCWTDCYGDSIDSDEEEKFYDKRYDEIKRFVKKMGKVEYDVRNIKQNNNNNNNNNSRRTIKKSHGVDPKKQEAAKNAAAVVAAKKDIFTPPKEPEFGEKI